MVSLLESEGSVQELQPPGQLPPMKLVSDNSATQLGDGTFWRWWSQMFYMKKSVLLKYFNG